MELTGASQTHVHNFNAIRKHPAGHKRARRIAVENGVEVDAKVTILRERDSVALANTNAHESIVAHLAHELREVRELAQAFVDAGGWMLAHDLFELVREGKKGNLHDRAWDEANRIVEEMRKRKNAQD
jgi:hypothetical protein